MLETSEKVHVVKQYYFHVLGLILDFSHIVEQEVETFLRAKKFRDDAIFVIDEQEVSTFQMVTILDILQIKRATRHSPLLDNPKIRDEEEIRKTMNRCVENLKRLRAAFPTYFSDKPMPKQTTELSHWFSKEP